MSGFRTGIIMQSKSNKDYNLPETYSISCLTTLFALEKDKQYLYTIDEGIVAYTTNPLNKIKTVDYKKEVNCICASPQCLYLLNDESLVFYSKNGFNVISADFKDMSLQLLENNKIGVQSKKELVAYDENFTRKSIFRCQCSFSTRNILLIGFVTTLKAYVKEQLIFEVVLPAYITSIITDSLFTKIYCATQDNNIYCYDLNGLPLVTMEYHQAPVKQLRLSFCGSYLYSSDGTRLCVWNTKHNVVMGYIDVEEGIDSFDTILVDDYQYNLDKCVI